MATINTLPLLTATGSLDGTEEYPLHKGGTDYKATGTEILATLTAALNTEIASTNTEILALQSGKLEKSGGTMTGDIVLNGNATNVLHPITKQQFDAALALKANTTGATLDAAATGVTAADTAETTAVATTAYVASKIEYEVNKQTIVAAASKTLVEAEKGIIAVNYTTTGTVNITLPLISGLTEATRCQYTVVDTGLNAGTNPISIARSGTDVIDGIAEPVSITSDGESVVLFTNGSGSWFIKDKVSIASNTKKGIVELSSTAEAEALTNATTAITPSTLGDVLDEELYSVNISASTSKTFVEADGGSKWFFTATASSPVAIALPNPTSLASAGRFVLTISDAGNATANDIVITPAGGTIDGATSFTIDSSYSSLTIYTNGTNYYTTGNTARATVPVTPGGVNSQFQYNNSGAFGASSVLTTDGTTLGIGNTAQSSHLIRLDGDSSAASRMLHIEHTETGGASYGVEMNLDGVAGSYHKFGYRTRIDGGGIGNDGICIAIEKGAYTTDVPSADIIFHGELGHTSRKNYGAYLIATSSNSQDNTGAYLNVANAGAGNAYALDIIAGDIKVGTGTGTKIGTAVTQKLGFWNVTPVVQPSSIGETTGYAAVGGTNVNSNDTFTGNSGTKAYTLNDVVKHLKAVGILVVS